MKGSCIKIAFLFLSITCCFVAHTQNLSGIWKGYFITDDGEQYKLEFQLGQERNMVVAGVSYSYLDIRFYGKSSMTGRFSKAEQSLSIQELKTLEVKNSSGGGTCLMNYKLALSQSGQEKYLEGTYLGKNENRQDPSKSGKWGDCGGGRVFLRKVKTSDFPVEPFLKNKPAKANKPVASKTSSPSKPIVKKPAPPVTKSAAPKALASVKAPIKKSVKKPTKPFTGNTLAPQKKVEQVVKNETQQPKAEATKKLDKPVIIPAQTRSRKNETEKIFEVTHREVLVKFYDNGEVDGDSISVYFDNQLILSNKGLTAEPITVTLQLDNDNTEHTLVMVAENMGRIPPNTALMVVQDGDKKYQANLTSTEQKNAMVRFRYKKPDP